MQKDAYGGYMLKYQQDNANYNGNMHWEFPGKFEDYQ